MNYYNSLEGSRNILLLHSFVRCLSKYFKFFDRFPIRKKVFIKVVSNIIGMQ